MEQFSHVPLSSQAESKNNNLRVLATLLLNVFLLLLFAEFLELEVASYGGIGSAKHIYT